MQVLGNPVLSNKVNLTNFLVVFFILITSCSHSSHYIQEEIQGQKQENNIKEKLVFWVDRGNTKEVQALIRSDTNHVISTEDLNEALFAANDREMLRLIIALGADINAQREGGYTLLMDAVLVGDEDLSRELVEKGANVNAVNTVGRTALRYAVHYGLFETVKLLVNEGANINSQDVTGFTPLMQAVSRNYEKIVKYLIDKGADVNIKDNMGNTALYYANKNKNIEIIEILKQSGARDAVGSNP